eukprot:RCo031304
MGDTLSRPITEKFSEKLEDERLRVGASGMQGWRRGMEDAHTCVLNLGGSKRCAFFGVYDGHCGQNTARFCGENLHKRLTSDPAFADGRYEEALSSAFLGIDEDLLRDPMLHNDGSGCTAVVVLVTDTEIYCGNAGDSRCVLCRDGKPVPLSQDHKPNNETELKRIQQAGSFVSSGRVNGNLALSRAIGDFDFKQNKSIPAADQAISAKPDVIVHKLTPEDEFLVLACDGVWDVMSNEDVMAFVRHQLTETDDVALICENVFDKCLAPQAPGVGCDNMTMILVVFRENLARRAAAAAAAS